MREKRYNCEMNCLFVRSWHECDLRDNKALPPAAAFRLVMADGPPFNARSSLSDRIIYLSNESEPSYKLAAYES